MAARTPYTRVDINGGSAPSELQSNILVGATSLAIDAGDASSWPTGSAGRFLICIARGTSTEEKVWATSRSGATVSFAVEDRGADGTSAAAHTAGVAVEVVIGSTHIDEANKAVVETIGTVTTAGDMLYAAGAADLSRLAIGASARVMISNGSAPTWTALSGDVTVNSSGVTAIGASKITNSMMADDAVDSAEIADGAVDRVHLAADIVDGTKIADDAIDSEHIADGAVDAAHMSANSIDSAQYVDGSIDPEHLADDAVTLAKLAAAAKARWMVGPFEMSPTPSSAAMWVPGSSHNPLFTQLPIPEACAVTGLSVMAESSRSGGSGSFEVTINGSGTGLTAAIDATNTRYHTATQAETADAVTAGQRIGVTMTDSSLLGVGAIHAWVLLQAV